MPFELDQFVQTRPVLYHLTRQSNLERIQRMQQLDSAAKLLDEAGRQDLLLERRERCLLLSIGDEIVHVRDQLPLKDGSIHFLDGWTLAKLVDHLNGFVFFWPGRESKPGDYALRHFGAYAGDDNVVLRFKTSEILAANSMNPPVFSRCNSGGPRTNPNSSYPGKRAPRGPETFVLAKDFDGKPGKVVEVAFRQTVSLRDCTIDVRSPHEFLSQT